MRCLDFIEALKKFRDRCSDRDRDKADFIEQCLSRKIDRPDAKKLSRHPTLFELSSLQILAAHKVYEYRTISQREFDNKLKEIECESDDKVSLPTRLCIYRLEHVRSYQSARFDIQKV